MGVPLACGGARLNVRMMSMNRKEDTAAAMDRVGDAVAAMNVSYFVFLMAHVTC